MTAAERAKQWRLKYPERYKKAKAKCLQRRKKYYMGKNRKWAVNHKKRTREMKRKWKKNNPDYERSRQYRKYGITIEQYEKMLAQQKGGCVLCYRPPKTKRLAVEHDHKSGRVRGLACFRCNKFLIGRRGVNDIPILQRLVTYLASDFDGRTI